MENHIDELKKSLKDNNEDEISKRIRSMPDFIAVNSKTNQVFLIDVKYRSFIDRREAMTALYGFSYAQINNYMHFWPETQLIVIHNHEPFFTVIPIKKVEWHKHLHSRLQNNGNLIEQWNFAGIERPIQELLKEIPEAAIKKAIDMIPKKS